MRMRLLTIVAVSLLLMAPTKPPVDVARSIVALRMPFDGKLKTFCSGVVAQTVPVPFIITEAHCLDGEDVDKMRVEDKALVEVARSHELVLLRVQGWLANAVPARVAERDAPSGSRVRAHGWAFGKFVAVTEGVVAGEWEEELYLDMQCVRGMSGGPILDEAGQVVTLVRAYQTDGVPFDPSPNGFTVGAPTRYLRDLLVIAHGYAPEK